MSCSHMSPNDYEKRLDVTYHGGPSACDCFECAIHMLAPPRGTGIGASAADRNRKGRLLLHGRRARPRS